MRNGNAQQKWTLAHSFVIIFDDDDDDNHSGAADGEQINRWVGEIKKKQQRQQNKYIFKQNKTEWLKGAS